jgi:hypothetical protein
MKKGLIFILFLVLFPIASKNLFFEMSPRSTSLPLQRLYVNCLCTNAWINGRVNNTAEVELRDGAAYGPILKNASVNINDCELDFAVDQQIYQGDIGMVEQWQRIPICIETQDGRKVEGYVTVVFLVRITEPQPYVHVPSSYQLPLSWEYSEGSMHTVELLVLKDNVELKALEVPGNSILLNFKRMGLPIKEGDVLQLRVLPFWTSNSELRGNLTKSSTAQFLTTATVTVKFAPSRLLMHSQ